MKAILYAFCCIAVLFACGACGSTIRLDYTGKHGAIGVGITLPNQRGLTKEPTP